MKASNYGNPVYTLLAICGAVCPVIIAPAALHWNLILNTVFLCLIGVYSLFLGYFQLR